MDRSKKEIEQRYKDYDYKEDIKQLYPNKSKLQEIIEIIKETYKRDPTDEEWCIIFKYDYHEILDQIHFLNVTNQYFTKNCSLRLN